MITQKFCSHSTVVLILDVISVDLCLHFCKINNLYFLIRDFQNFLAMSSDRGGMVTKNGVSYEMLDMWEVFYSAKADKIFTLLALDQSPISKKIPIFFKFPEPVTRT